MSFARMNFGRATLRFGPLRLAVVLLGDRLSGAAIQQTRVDTFVIEAENPGEALRAELDARGLAPRSVALGLARTAVAVKDRKSTRLNSSHLVISYAVFCLKKKKKKKK